MCSQCSLSREIQMVRRQLSLPFASPIESESIKTLEITLWCAYNACVPKKAARHIDNGCSFLPHPVPVAVQCPNADHKLASNQTFLNPVRCGAGFVGDAGIEGGQIRLPAGPK